MADYPKRDKFHAHRVVRALSKTCAAQEIGTDACWLIAVIAHQEDAKRYSGAVTYFNEQLMPICGFGGRSRLVTARTKAVQSGWLHYEPGAKHTCGRYWTLLPEVAKASPDTRIGEAYDEMPSQNRTEIAVPEQDGNQDGNEMPSQIGTETRTATGRKPGRQLDGNQDGNRAPFLPSPGPDPDPSPKRECVRDYRNAKGWTFPECWSDRCHEWFGLWQASRKKNHFAELDSISWQAAMMRRNAWNESQWFEALTYSTEKGVKAIYHPSEHDRKPNVQAKPAPDPNWEGIEDLKGIPFCNLSEKDQERFLDFERKRNAHIWNG